MIPALRLPPGHSPMGSPPPSLALSADDSAFYGVQTKVNGAAYAFRVYHQLPIGTATAIETGIAGQGRLQETGGLLVASGCQAAGDGKPVVSFVVPGFVAGAVSGPQVMMITPDSPIGQLWRGPDYQPTDFDTPKKTAQRVDKQLDAINQLVDMLVTVGLAKRS